MTAIYPLAPIRTEAELRAQAKKIQSHPEFLSVLYEYTRKLSDYREASRPLAKLIANEDRYRTLNFIYTYWSHKVANGGDGSMTFGELHEICRRGEVTPRILKTILSLAVLLKFLKRTPNPDDRRSWLYKPTESMIAFPQQWLMPAAEALDTLQPHRARAARLLKDPGVLIHLFRSAGHEFAAGIQPMTIQDDFMTFFGRKEGGAVFTMGLLLAERDGLPPPSRTAIAQRYALTKSQVNRLVGMGEEMGLLTLENGRPSATPVLCDSHAEWVALSLAFLGHHLWPEVSE